MRMIRHAAALGTLILLLATTTQVQAETRHIHVLKILDDASPEYVIREGCRSIGYGIDQEVALMKDKLGILNVIEYTISGSNFSRERLDEVLEYDMEYMERDIVVLVYVGHGFRPPGSDSPFPSLYFNGYEEAIDFGEVQELILEKNPSLLLSIVIACNVTQADPSLPPPYLGDNEAPPVVTLQRKGLRRTEPYWQLFADQPGVTKCIDLISADREYYTFLSRDGGIFFSEVLYTFQEVFTDLSYSSWDAICSDISERTQLRSQERGLAQQPVCRYYVRMNPVVVPARVEAVRSRSYCKDQLRDLRRDQRQALRDLRRTHRQQLRQLRQEGGRAEARQLLGRQHRAELANWKLQHAQEYHRGLQHCMYGSR